MPRLSNCETGPHAVAAHLDTSNNPAWREGRGGWVMARVAPRCWPAGWRASGFRVGRFSSAHIPAAVDVDGLAGDVAVAGQHDGDRGDLVRRAEATDRNEGRLDRGGTLDHVGFG